MQEVILDSAKRMSHSLLWKLQKDAYCQFGIQAWGKHRVPSYITSNTFTTKAYAHVVLGFLRDCLSSHVLDLSEPIYIIDLGAGTGRFAYFFIKKLLQALDALELTEIKICYVLTDISHENIAFWQQHPLLEPFFKKGVLDCAYFEHSQKKPLELIKSKKILNEKEIVNPPVLIANYFFDTIPHDLFRIKDGKLEEGHATILAKPPEDFAESDISIDNPAIIKHLQCRYSYHPIDSHHYYPDPLLNDILQQYEREFNDCTFLFPIGGFETLSHFIEWSKGRLLLLAGDHGVYTDQQLRKWGEPQLALHGSFSLSVNFHAMARYFRYQNGIVHAAFADTLFGVMAAILEGGVQGMRFLETAWAFEENIRYFEPKDYWELVNQSEKQWKTPTMEQILLLLKFGIWDSMSFQTFFNQMRIELTHASEGQKERLLEGIALTMEAFYPITPESGNFILNLGVLYHDLHRYQESLNFFERSMQITGPNATVLKNKAICHRKLGNEKAAIACETEAIGLPEIDSTHK